MYADELDTSSPVESTSPTFSCSLTVDGMTGAGTYDGTSIGDGTAGGLGSHTWRVGNGGAVYTTSRGCNCVDDVQIRLEQRAGR